MDSVAIGTEPRLSLFCLFSPFFCSLFSSLLFSLFFSFFLCSSFSALLCAARRWCAGGESVHRHFDVCGSLGHWHILHRHTRGQQESERERERERECVCE